MDLTREREGSFDLTQNTLRFSEGTQALLEASRVKKFVGPLLASLQEKRARKIAVLTWDDETLLRKVSQLLVVAFAEQLDQACALTLSEGIRFGREDFEGFSLVRIPELAVAQLGPQGEKILRQLDSAFPVQVFVGPLLSELDEKTLEGNEKLKLAKAADVRILVLPDSGITKAAMTRIQSLTARAGLDWMGILRTRGDH